MANILMVGCGQLGQQMGLSLIDSGHHITALRRNPAGLPAAFTPFAADVTQRSSLTGLAALAFDYVIVTLTAGEFSDQAYKRVYVDGLANVLAVLGEAKILPKRLFLASSTSVYHQVEGEYVDELSATEPQTFSGRRQLEAEQEAINSPIPTTVVRFSGIYGPTRFRLIEQVLAGEGGSYALYTNRIHVLDCSGFVCHLLAIDQHTADNQLYIATDSTPVTMGVIKQWLAEQLGVDPTTLTVSTNGRRGSKRIGNNKMLATGYSLRYPSYKIGYAEVVKAWQAKH